jgi:hypothetical protein
MKTWNELTEETRTRLGRAFGAWYNYFYEKGYSKKLVDFFDDTIKTDAAFKDIVAGFVKYRGDYISSDREAAAFTAAYNQIFYGVKEV